MRGGVAAVVGAALVVPWLVIGISALLFFNDDLPLVGQTDLSLWTIGIMHVVCTFPLVAAIVSAPAGPVRPHAGGGGDRPRRIAAQMLRRVVLPHLTPALVASAIFAYMWSFNNFEISYFVGGSDYTFPVWAFSTLRHGQNLPIVNAISTVISARPGGARRSSPGGCCAGRGRPRRRRRADADGRRCAEWPPSPPPRPARRGKRGILRRSLRPLAFLWCPTGLLILFFLVPMVIMLKISFQHESLYDFQHRLDARQLPRDPHRPALPRGRPGHASGSPRAAMIIQLAIAVPAGLRDGVPRRPLRAAAAAGPGAGRRAQPDRADLRLARAARAARG